MLKQLIKKFLAALGLDIVRKKPKSASSGNIGQVGFLKHEGHKRGNALISYIVEPFLLQDEDKISNAHDHDWVSWQIGRTFSSYGYDVDVIDYDDRKFIPQKSYDFFIGARTNFQRLSELLPEKCIKIVHLDTAHWLFNNSADYRRHLDLQERRGVVLESFKWVEPNWAIEYADCATAFWGNQFNVSTYQYSGKPIIQIPVPTCAVYPEPDCKDFNACKNHFLWFGSEGLVHKGLDLVLEAFEQMPEYHLTVCGPLRNNLKESCNGPLKHDAMFEEAYHRELYECENIHTVGWVDIESEIFKNIINQCVGVVFPSCSEGGGTSAITCMQAGLIPIVSYETNIEVEDFGFTLNVSSIEEIKESVYTVSDLPTEELKIRSRKAWEFCRTHHTREKFVENYRDVIDQIMVDHNKNYSGK
jgi:glycosyltransferase involved in cell wall biosynthesis